MYTKQGQNCDLGQLSGQDPCVQNHKLIIDMDHMQASSYPTDW